MGTPVIKKLYISVAKASRQDNIMPSAVEFLMCLSQTNNGDDASYDVNSGNTHNTVQSHWNVFIYQTEVADHLPALVSNIPLLPKAMGC